MKKLIILSLFMIYGSIANAEDISCARGEQLTQINYNLAQILIEIKRQNAIICTKELHNGDKDVLKLCEPSIKNKGEI